MPIEKYNELVNKFNDKYKMEFSYFNYKNNATYAVDMLKEAFKNLNIPYFTYAHILKNALIGYFVSATSFKTNKHDLSKFNLAQFVLDCEEILQEWYISHPEDTLQLNRQPFEGSNLENVSSLLLQLIRVNVPDKPISQIWGERIVKEDVSGSEMKVFTNALIRKLENVTPETLGDNRKDLANIIMAKQALEYVRKKRDFKFKVFSFFQNIKEKIYLKELKNKIKSYTDAGFPVSEIEKEISLPIIAGVEEKFKDELKQKNVVKQDDNSKEHKKEIVKDEKAYKKILNEFTSPENAKDAIEKACEYIKNKDKQLIIKDAFLKAFPENDEVKSKLENFDLTEIFQDQKEILNEYDLEKLIGSRKQALDNMVVKVYNVALLNVGLLGYKDNISEEYNKETYAVAQIFTDIMMKNFAPDSSEYVSGYVLNHHDVFKRVNNNLSKNGKFDGSKDREFGFPEGSKDLYNELTGKRQNLNIDLNEVDNGDLLIEQNEQIEELQNSKDKSNIILS